MRERPTNVFIYVDLAVPVLINVLHSFLKEKMIKFSWWSWTSRVLVVRESVLPALSRPS